MTDSTEISVGSGLLLIGSMLLLAMFRATGAMAGDGSIPNGCPVTRLAPEARFTPASPAHRKRSDDAMFWYGSDSLYTRLFSDGRWRGVASQTGVRNKSFWYRNEPDWMSERQPQLIVSATRLEAESPMVVFPRISHAIMGSEAAMLLMLELPGRGCWQVTANYKSDYVSFVTWVD